MIIPYTGFARLDDPASDSAPLALDNDRVPRSRKSYRKALRLFAYGTALVDGVYRGIHRNKEFKTGKILTILHYLTAAVNSGTQWWRGDDEDAILDLVGNVGLSMGVEFLTGQVASRVHQPPKPSAVESKPVTEVVQPPLRRKPPFQRNRKSLSGWSSGRKVVNTVIHGSKTCSFVMGYARQQNSIVEQLGLSLPLPNGVDFICRIFRRVKYQLRIKWHGTTILG